MRANLEGAVGRAETFRWIVFEELRDEILRFAAERVLGEIVVGRGVEREVFPVDVAVNDIGEQFIGRIAGERRDANEKLVENDAHTPPVHWFAVALPEDHFGCDVRRCAEDLLIVECFRFFVDVLLVVVRGQRHETDLRQAEIGQFDVSDGCDEQIIGFEISMDDPVGVEVFHGQCGLGKVHAGDVEVQWTTDVLQKGGHVAAFDVFHHQTQVILRLERAEERDDEWIVREGHDVAFDERLLDLIAKNQVRFRDLLHCVALVRMPVLDEMNDAVGTVGDQFDDLEIFFRRTLVREGMPDGWKRRIGSDGQVVRVGERFILALRRRAVRDAILFDMIRIDDLKES